MNGIQQELMVMVAQKDSVLDRRQVAGNLLPVITNVHNAPEHMRQDGERDDHREWMTFR